MANLRPWMWRVVFVAFLLFFVAAGTIFGSSIMFTVIFLMFQGGIHPELILGGLGGGALVISCTDIREWLNQYAGFRQAEEAFDPGGEN